MRNLSTRAAGLLILVMGLWGGLAPFVGPYFHFALGPDKSWTWTTGRLWLSVLPAAVAVLGGLMLIGSGPRPGGKLGALLALAAGLWFAIGPQVSLLWNASGAQGVAHGATGVRVLEMLTYHTLLGSLMAALAGYALPGLVTRPTRAETAEAAPAPAAATPTAIATTAPATRAELPREPGDRQARAPVAPAEAPAVVANTRTHTALSDREITPDATAQDESSAPVTDGASAEDRPTNIANGPNGDGRSIPATAPPTTSATTPTTVRRRRGGLLSILRR
jgi:hypothetical protein